VALRRPVFRSAGHSFVATGIARAHVDPAIPSVAKRSPSAVRRCDPNVAETIVSFGNLRMMEAVVSQRDGVGA
jgi:hypothetical protein